MDSLDSFGVQPNQVATVIVLCSVGVQCEMTSLVEKATSGGYRVEIHVIGDRAADVAMNSLETVTAARRPVLIHCQVSLDDRMKREIILSQRFGLGLRTFAVFTWLLHPDCRGY